MTTTADLFETVLDDLKDQIVETSGDEPSIGAMMLLEILRQIDPDCTFKLVETRNMLITFSDGSTSKMIGTTLH